MCVDVSPRVCFAFIRLPHNKRGVLQGETDKHLDKLNKAFTHSCLRLCIYLRVLRLVRIREPLCLFGFLQERFVESAEEANCVLTLLHVFVFVPPAAPWSSGSRELSVP